MTPGVAWLPEPQPCPWSLARVPGCVHAAYSCFVQGEAAISYLLTQVRGCSWKTLKKGEHAFCQKQACLKIILKRARERGCCWSFLATKFDRLDNVHFHNVVLSSFQDKNLKCFSLTLFQADAQLT